MRYVKLLAALFFIVCLTACSNNNALVGTDGSETISTIETTANIANETSCPFGDISEDKIRLMSPAYAPSLLEPAEDTAKEIANALRSSEWEIIDNETPLPDGENYSVFVYNEGQPFRLTFYSDHTAEYEQNDIVKKYKISEEAFITIFNAANPKTPVADELIWCEPENVSAEGVWLDI